MPIPLTKKSQKKKNMGFKFYVYHKSTYVNVHSTISAPTLYFSRNKGYPSQTIRGQMYWIKIKHMYLLIKTIRCERCLLLDPYTVTQLPPVKPPDSKRLPCSLISSSQTSQVKARLAIKGLTAFKIHFASLQQSAAC